METTDNKDNTCCPLVDVQNWDDIIHDWESKHFIKSKVRTFLYMPLNFGKVITELDKKIRGAGAICQDSLCLSDHTSRWNMNIYLAVDKEISGADNVSLSGSYYSKVYEGPFSKTAEWCRDYREAASRRALNTGKMYMWYTTCPACAKKYGKNYVVIISKIE